jgi:hypothetical protein
MISGSCKCGAVRYEIDGAPVMTALCHCTMCRRANAAPTVAWAMFRIAQVTFTGERPTEYASSAEARRGFCGRCGSQISFTASFLPGLIDITIGSLDQPQAMAPRFHYWDSQRLPWLQFADGLPRHAELPPTG